LLEQLLSGHHMSPAELDDLVAKQAKEMTISNISTGMS
jgi:hypothetical protein